MEAPIPGRSLVGIEVPNKSISLVRLGSLLKECDFQKTASSLSFALGRNVKGEALLTNLSKMPHLLIAGSTGSGKSVCIHSILLSFLFKNSPETLRLILVDPKRVELSHYNEIPHLLTPVITDYKKVLPALRWATNEMERRYNLLSEYKSRDIEGYNLKVLAKKEMPLPYIVIIIDELADLMARYGHDLEGLIIRIAQMARATGIHLIVSTQRPSVEVITGLIKANITARIAFQVASQVDSRTILDMGGAEKLLGSGDMLYLAPNYSKPRRVQSAYVSEEEVNNLVRFIVNQSEVGKEENGLAEDLEEFIEGTSSSGGIDFETREEDELYPDAYDVVIKAKKASASLLQRRLRVGYARAARLLDILEEKGIVGPVNGAKPREVFIKEEEENYEQ
jgi:S-DNA-T family DNA segregation ATPase FtsK/SpoIIIE